jgi:hypothetical protein
MENASMTRGLKFGALLFIWLLSDFAPASESATRNNSSTIRGKVTDQKNAPVPGVVIEIADTQTGIGARTETDYQGDYFAAALSPGSYNVTAYLPGFKRTRSPNVRLAANDSMNVDLKLEIAEIAEEIAVIVETRSGDSDTDGSLLLGSLELDSYPMSGGSAFSLMELAGGLQWDPDPDDLQAGTRPFDNTRQWSMNGSQPGTNAFLLNGAPNSVRGRYNISPTVEAIAEFRVLRGSFDAQYGGMGGNLINVIVKQGTPRLRGTLFYLLRNSVFDANTFQNNRQGVPDKGRQFNHFGAVVSGPAPRPWRPAANEKTFFMASYEGLRDLLPRPVYATVPTLAQRRGDFSQTFSQGKPVLIYDPLTTRYDNVQKAWVRDTFVDNRLPAGRLNPVALNLLEFIPTPNAAGDPDTGFNNYFASPNKSRNYYDSFIARTDSQIGRRDRLNLTFVYNHLSELRNINGLPGVALRGNWQHERTNHALIANWVSVRSSKTVLELRISINRYNDSDDKRSGDHFDVNQLGFQGTISALEAPTYPHLTFEQYTEAGPGEKIQAPDATANLQGILSRTKGRHIFKVGGEVRHIQSNRINYGEASGRFDFTRAFTRRDPNTADALSGNSIASFLLGYPSGGNVDVNAARSERWRYFVAFFQDDIRLRDDFALGFGLRWDYEQPLTEKYDRINRGFDFKAVSPYQALVNPSFGLDLRGGLLFAGSGGQPRGGFNPTWNTWQPRAGFAWRLRDKTVLRGGYGLYFQTTAQLGTQAGFSRSTPFLGSLDNRTPALNYNTLENPYPKGLILPSGSAEGLGAMVGYGFSFEDPARRVPSTHLFSIGVQRELGDRVELEVSYVGSRTHDMAVSKSVNEISAAQLAQGSTILNKQVSNPFWGILPVAVPLGRTQNVAQSQLMRPHPQFLSLTMNALGIGNSWYNSLQVRLEKQYLRGLRLGVLYTWSKIMEKAAFLNPQDSELSRELASYDRTHYLTVHGIWDIPPGRYGVSGKTKGGAARTLLGGWRISWMGLVQSGVPTNYPAGAELTGIDPRMPDGLQTLDRWFNPAKAGSAAAAAAGPFPFYVRPGYTLRRTPLRFPNLRNHTRPQLSVALHRSLKLSERWTGELRIESFNVTNTPIFPGPNTDINSGNFGKVTRNQINSPRYLQIGLRLRF